MAGTNKKKYNKEYNEAFNSLQQIINDIDPMGIAFCGIDEYNPEIRDIFAELRNCDTEENIRIMVIAVFTKWFGKQVNIDIYNDVGQKLMQIKKKYDWLNLPES